jgi:hypothetical protein
VGVVCTVAVGSAGAGAAWVVAGVVAAGAGVVAAGAGVVAAGVVVVIAGAVVVEAGVVWVVEVRSLALPGAEASVDRVASWRNGAPFSWRARWGVSAARPVGAEGRLRTAETSVPRSPGWIGR